MFALLHACLKLLRLGLVALSAATLTLAALAPPRQVAAQTPLPGSIQGYVAAVVGAKEQFAIAAPTARATIAPGSLIYVPDIAVTARNVQTRAESAPEVTN